ncbi:MAG: APC family permease, partial [Firmicutes bacterium]|nr:APC family permease [Bacillota bacterium]
MKNENHALNKQMNQGAVWALAVGAIIGWGCFIQGAEWTRQAGGPLALVIGFLAGGLLMIVVGLCYSYLIPKIKVAGGEFAYTYYSFGRTSAFACGWMMLLGYVTLAAMNATAIPVLASYIFPGVFKFGYLYTMAGYEVYAGEILLSLFFLTLFAALNIIGIKKTGKTQLTMAVILCLAVLAAVCGTLFSGRYSVSNLQPSYGAGKSLFAGVLSIFVVTPYCFVGFDTIPQAAEEFDFSHQKVKKLIVSALIIGALIYIAMALITDIVIPWQDLFSLRDSDGEPVKWLTGAMLERSMGKIGTTFVSVAVLMAIFTGINGFYLAASRLLFGMGRSKMLPQSFGMLHKQYHTPSAAILFVMLVCFICPFFGRNVLGWVIDM